MKLNLNENVYVKYILINLWNQNKNENELKPINVYNNIEHRMRNYNKNIKLKFSQDYITIL